MITILLINFIVLVFGMLFVFFPIVTIADIPLIGSSLSSILVTMIHTWNAFIVTFPYADTAWQIFLYVIIPFELIVLLMKFFLGARSPVKN